LALAARELLQDLQEHWSARMFLLLPPLGGPVALE
jgi:hypothetical protein